jgi:hypothetical protein
MVSASVILFKVIQRGIWKSGIAAVSARNAVAAYFANK